MKSVFSFLVTFLVFGGSIAVNKIQPEANPAFKNKFLARVNAARQKGCRCGMEYMPPVAPLTWNDRLAKAAVGHAEDMYENNYFSHTSKDGRTSEDRIMAAGYTDKGFKSYYIGENIAFGQMNIDEVMDGWLKSPGHCHNLMMASFKEIGIAQYNNYWVQDFGGRQPFSAEEQKLIKSGRMRIIPRSK